MKISKPMHISLVHRCLSYSGRHLFSVAGILPFNIRNGDLKFEQEFWGALADILVDGPFDSGIPKGTPEFLLNAVFYPPKHQTISEGWARAKVGDVEKKVAVFGDRYWLPGGKFSPPAPIEKQALNYGAAFGSGDNLFNPKGRGEVDPDNIPESTSLPNVELLSELILSARDRPRAVAFNQLDVMSKFRQDKFGDLNEQQDPYSFPDNIDWHFFNDAYSDQWFDKTLTGDESFCFENMHPEYSKIEGCPPQYHIRCFVSRHDLAKGESVQAIEEIKMTLDTLWFAPHKELGALIFHGACDVKNRFADDISHLLLAFEGRSETNKTINHYKQSMIIRENPEDAHKYAIYSKDLIAEDCESDMEALFYQDDPDAIQNFTGSNIQEYTEKKTDEAKKIIEEKLNEVDVQLQSVCVNNELEEKLIATVKSIDEQLLTIREQKGDSIDKVKNELESAKNTILEKISDIKNLKIKVVETIPALKEALVDEHVPDPDLQALLDFIASIAPKSRKYPEHVDIARVDFKAMDKLEEKIQAYLDAKMKLVLPTIKEALANTKVSIAALPESCEAIKENAEKGIAAIEENQAEPDIVIQKQKAQEKLTAGMEQVNNTIVELDSAIDQQEEMIEAFMRGEPPTQKLFRPPSITPLERLQTELHQQLQDVKAKISDAKTQLAEVQAHTDISSNELEPEHLEKVKQLNSSDALEKMDIEQFLTMVDELESNLAHIDVQKEQLIAAEPGLKNGYRMGAHAMDVGLYPHDRNVSENESRFAKLIEKAKTLDNSLLDCIDGDFPCMEHTETNISDIDFSGCYFEQCSWANCQFEQVNFQRSISVRWKVLHCSFIGCDFTAANLGASIFESTTFEQCVFEESILSNSTFSQCEFIDCRLENCQSLDLILNTNTFTQCHIQSLHLIKQELIGNQFSQTKIIKSALIESDSPNTQFDECQLQDLAIIDSKLNATSFKSSRLENISFIGKTVLTGGDFSKVVGENINFKGIELKDASFLECSLAGVLFAQCNLSDACLAKSELIRAQFMSANLSDCDFQGANLMEANLSGANLQRVNFGYSNLYCADFLDATLGESNFFSANLAGTILQDWRPM